MLFMQAGPPWKRALRLNVNYLVICKSYSPKRFERCEVIHLWSAQIHSLVLHWALCCCKCSLHKGGVSDWCSFQLLPLPTLSMQLPPLRVLLIEADCCPHCCLLGSSCSLNMLWHPCYRSCLHSLIHSDPWQPGLRDRASGDGGVGVESQPYKVTRKSQHAIVSLTPTQNVAACLNSTCHSICSLSKESLLLVHRSPNRCFNTHTPVPPLPPCSSCWANVIHLKKKAQHSRPLLYQTSQNVYFCIPSIHKNPNAVSTESSFRSVAVNSVFILNTQKALESSFALLEKYGF